VYSRGALKSSALCWAGASPPNGDQPVELACGISKAQLPVRLSGAAGAGGGSSAGGGPLGANDCQAGTLVGDGEGCAQETGSSARAAGGSP
jgi:hypothetical protein